MGAVVVLILSLFAVARLHISASLQTMLGDKSHAAAAMQRVTTQYRAGDALLVLAEMPTEMPADDAGKKSLVEFATRLESSLGVDPAAKALVAWVRFREDPALTKYMREVVLPNGAYYLSDDATARLLDCLTADHIRTQISRNEAMIAAPGPVGGALSASVLRDPLRLFELIPREMAAARASGVEANLSSEFLNGVEFSDDGRAMLIRVGCVKPATDLAAAAELVGIVAAHVRRANITGLRTKLAGPAAVASSSARVIRADAIVSTLVSVGLLYVLFVVFYRRWTAPLLIGAVAGVGMLAGIGIYALFATEVSPLAAAIAALLAGLGTDYGIHFVSHYDGYREQGLSSEDASIQTAAQMALPIITNCFTSIFGFISLWPSPIRMLSDFAIMGAAGLLGALVAVFVLMPAMLRLFDRSTHAPSGTSTRFGVLADHVAGRPRTWMVSTLLILAIVTCAAGMQGFVPRFESDLTVMHPRPNPALDASLEVIRRFSGQGELIPVEVRAASPESLVTMAHDAARALQSQSCRDMGVTGVLGLHLLLPDPRGAPRTLARMASINPDGVVGSFDAAIAQSVFEPSAYAAYRNTLRALASPGPCPTVQDLLAYPSLAERLFPVSIITSGTPPAATVLVVRLGAPLHDRVLRKRAIETLDQAVASLPGVTIAGLAAVSEELEDAARSGLPQSVAISVVLVVVWLMLVFRRPMDVLLAMLPLLFAGATTVLFMVATKQRFNPINSVAIPLLDGIAMDAGVFLVATSRAHGATRAQLRANLRPTTHAVLLAVSTTVTAFGALCFTHTPAIRSLGFVAAVGSLASMVGALFVLMPILIWRAPDAKAR